MTGTRIGQFWETVAAAPLVVLTDFDYTISNVDIGDLLTTTFAPPSPETIARYRTREIGTRLYWADSMVRVDPARGAAVAEGVGIDPSFPEFVRWAESQGIPLAVVSDGFGFYIQRVLAREGLSHLPVFCNEMPEAGRMEFPHGNAVCDRCGCCKAGVARRLREAGKRIVYCGDGSSDMYACSFVDWVFAKGRLADYLRKLGTPFFPLHSFANVTATLKADLEGFQAGTAPGRSTLAQSPFCRF